MMSSPSKVPSSPRHNMARLQSRGEEQGNLDALGGSLAGLNIGNYEYGGVADNNAPVNNGNISHHSRISSTGSIAVDELTALSDSLHLGAATGWPNVG